MRNNQTDEADQSGHGYGSSRQKGRNRRKKQPIQADLNAERLRHFISKLKNIRTFGAQKSQYKSNSRINGQQLHLRPRSS